MKKLKRERLKRKKVSQSTFVSKGYLPLMLSDDEEDEEAVGDAKRSSSEEDYPFV